MKRLACMFCITICVVLCCAITAFATESIEEPYVVLKRSYSGDITLTVPGLNKSVSTKSLEEGGFVFKASDDAKCTFHTIANEEGAGADGRLINSKNEKRSAWARDLLTDTIRTANTEGATKGYLYYAQISSDLLAFSNFDITFSFSPDDMT